jgi:hypothetical protein
LRRMPRPKQDITKEQRIDVRMHAVLRDALERIAHSEGRSLSHLSERELRRFAIEYFRKAGWDHRKLDQLPP